MASSARRREGIVPCLCKGSVAPLLVQPFVTDSVVWGGGVVPGLCEDGVAPVLAQPLVTDSVVCHSNVATTRNLAGAQHRPLPLLLKYRPGSFFFIQLEPVAGARKNRSCPPSHGEKPLRGEMADSRILRPYAVPSRLHAGQTDFHLFRYRPGRQVIRASPTALNAIPNLYPGRWTYPTSLGTKTADAECFYCSTSSLYMSI